MTNRTWVNRLCSLALTLATGCVYQGTTGTPVVAHSPSESTPIPRHEPAPVTRAASSIDPPTPPVQVEMIPAPLPPMIPPPLPMPANAPAPPAPTPVAVPEKLPPLVAALRAVLDRHPSQARKELENVDRSQRERLLALLHLAAASEDAQLERLSPGEVTATLEHLNDLCRRLRPKAPLKIDHVCLCRGIQGFGQYDRVDSSHAYRAGSEGRAGERVQVYAEVGNFASRVAADGRHETRLATVLEIQEMGGTNVARMDLGTCSDLSHSPRSDYFLNFQFHIPATIEPGTHTLIVTVRDATTDGPGREAKVSLPLRIRAR